MAHWHGLAKLRLHTDVTLNIMEAVTTSLGQQLRKFKRNTCEKFETRELQREAEARARRQSQKSRKDPTVMHMQNSSTTSAITHPSATGAEASSTPPSLQHIAQTGLNTDFTCDRTNLSNAKGRDSTRRPKTLNLNTYKCHALGDYVNTIRKYGTTDSYSTEPVRVPSYPLYVGLH
jgi:hypothetical protein